MYNIITKPFNGHHTIETANTKPQENTLKITTTTTHRAILELADTNAYSNDNNEFKDTIQKNTDTDKYIDNDVLNDNTIEENKEEIVM